MLLCACTAGTQQTDAEVENLKKEVTDFQADADAHTDTLREMKSLVRARLEKLDPSKEGEIEKLKSIVKTLTETDKQLQQLVMHIDSLKAGPPASSERVVYSSRKRQIDVLREKINEALSEAKEVLSDKK